MVAIANPSTARTPTPLRTPKDMAYYTFRAVATEPATPPPAAEAEVVARIRKMLERGLHENTPVAEATRCMRLADAMLAKHHLDKDAVLASNDSGGEDGGAAHVVRVTAVTPRGRRPTRNPLMLIVVDLVARLLSRTSPAPRRTPWKWSSTGATRPRASPPWTLRAPSTTCA